MEKSASFIAREEKSGDSPRPSNPNSNEEQPNEEKKETPTDEKQEEEKEAEEHRELDFNADYQRISEEIDQFLQTLPIQLQQQQQQHEHEKKEDQQPNAAPEKKDDQEHNPQSDSAPETCNASPHPEEERSNHSPEEKDSPKKKIEELESHQPSLQLPDSIEKLAKMVESEIAKYNVSKDFGRWSRESSDEEASSLLEAFDKVTKLAGSLGVFPSQPAYVSAVHRTSALLHRAMLFLEEEFRALLDESAAGGCDGGAGDLKTRQMSMSSSNPEAEKCTPRAADAPEASFPSYSPEAVERMGMIAKAMFAAGYEAECCLAFATARRSAFVETLSKMGWERISIDDVQKMPWEALENDIGTWIKACKRSTAILLPGERKFSQSVFSHSPSVGAALYADLAYGVMSQLLNFAEAVTLTKRSAEKLFKFLDVYETLSVLGQAMTDGELFPEGSGCGSSAAAQSPSDLKTEAYTAQCRLGNSAISIFSDLENSIKSDNGKTPVPGGAVHPLTRYVMNYVKYVCEYKETLEQVFQEHLKEEKPDDSSSGEESNGSGGGSNAAPAAVISRHSSNAAEESSPPSPFSVQLMAVMDLLDSNLESKSKLYRDISLSYIFLMNNGRYIMQKIKGSAEIHELLGANWCRKRSSDLRQYHKNYQRETWGKVLQCLRHEGLMQGKGAIVKPALKERFKTFNAVFEEIHKTQSMWVVSDEQLQSELRVSISAVVIPAYRAFSGRFQQYLDPGRQTEKYIKYGPEELEACVDELFDGTPASMVRRR
ncbi:hypothetical protein ACLOJK_018793 [Asimina triloba]